MNEDTGWHDGQPTKMPGVYEVETTNGNIRRVVPNPHWYGFVFVDCQHGLQNTICDANRIVRWRKAESGKE